MLTICISDLNSYITFLMLTGIQTASGRLIAAEQVRIAGQARTIGDRSEETRDTMLEAFTSLPEMTFPNLIRLAPVLTKPDWEAEFEFGLRLLLDGLSDRLQRHSDADNGTS